LRDSSNGPRRTNRATFTWRASTEVQPVGAHLGCRTVGLAPEYSVRFTPPRRGAS